MFMKTIRYKIILCVLSLAGVAFAGYLSAVKLFSHTCAFKESCPSFLGYSACYYGLAMFATLFFLSFLLMFGVADAKKSLNYITLVSFLGILFAGYFTMIELPVLFAKGFGAYALGLPTCALGLIFYIIIFAFALFNRKKVS